MASPTGLVLFVANEKTGGTLEMTTPRAYQPTARSPRLPTEFRFVDHSPENISPPRDPQVRGKERREIRTTAVDESTREGYTMQLPPYTRRVGINHLRLRQHMAPEPPSRTFPHRGGPRTWGSSYQRRRHLRDRNPQSEQCGPNGPSHCPDVIS